MRNDDLTREGALSDHGDLLVRRDGLHQGFDRSSGVMSSPADWGGQTKDVQTPQAGIGVHRWTIPTSMSLARSSTGVRSICVVSL